MVLAVIFLFSLCGFFISEYNYNIFWGGLFVQECFLYEEENRLFEDSWDICEDEEDCDIEIVFEEEDEGLDVFIEAFVDDFDFLEIEEVFLCKEVVDYVKIFLGIKYKLGGILLKSGFDCLGFIFYVMKQVDIVFFCIFQVQENNGKKVCLKNV